MVCACVSRKEENKDISSQIFKRKKKEIETKKTQEYFDCCCCFVSRLFYMNMDDKEIPSLAEVHIAASHLRSISLPITPILTSTLLNTLTGRNIYLKCENFQRTGSFKSRGALNAVLNAMKVDPDLKGFVTHSSGNHGQALAYAASIVNRPCVVVVPQNTPKNKTDAIEHYGAELVVCGSTPTSRVDTCLRISQERDYLIIPPYDSPDVIAGKKKSLSIMSIKFKK